MGYDVAISIGRKPWHLKPIKKKICFKKRKKKERNKLLEFGKWSAWVLCHFMNHVPLSFSHLTESYWMDSMNFLVIIHWFLQHLQHTEDLMHRRQPRRYETSCSKSVLLWVTYFNYVLYKSIKNIIYQSCNLLFFNLYYLSIY